MGEYAAANMPLLHPRSFFVSLARRQHAILAAINRLAVSEIMIPTPRISTIVLLIILLLAFSLRVHNLGEQPLRWDEAFSVWEAQMDLAQLTEFTASDVHPPLYFWLLHGWVKVAGISEFAIRALSALSGLVSIAAVYAITCRLCHNRLAAWLATLLIATSPYHIHWSQDARNYAVATMFTCLAVYASLRPRPLLFAISGIGAAMCHYFGALVVGILALREFLFRRDMGMKRRGWLAALAAIAVVCLVWGGYTAGLMRKDPSLAIFDPLAPFVVMANVFAVNSATTLDSAAPTVFIIATIFFLGLALSWRDDRRAAALILLGCLLPPAFIAALGLPFIPVHVNALQERHFNIFAPFVFAGFGIGLAAMLRRRWLRPLAAFAVAGLLLFNADLTLKRADQRYFKDDYRTMMAAVAALTTEHDRVYFVSGGRKPIVYYHLDRVGHDAPSNYRAEPLNVIGIPRQAADVDAMMRDVFFGVTGFWLLEVEAHLDEPPGARVDWLNARYHRLYHIPVGWNGISYYSIDPKDEIPAIDTIIPPGIAEARPGDHVRIGVPAGTRVDLVHSGQVVDSRLSEVWTLHEFDI